VKRIKSFPGPIKFKVALELIKGEKTLVELSREYGVHPNTLLKWKQTLLKKGAEFFDPPNKERISEAHPSGARGAGQAAGSSAGSPGDA